MIMGGAVAGGDIYGTLPVFTPGGPSDVGSNGRWIPTHRDRSVWSYAREMVRSALRRFRRDFSEPCEFLHTDPKFSLSVDDMGVIAQTLHSGLSRKV